MDGISRRRILMGGGAISALGAIQLASPRPAWSWSPLGSIAGSGAGLDPTTVWDAAADPVVAGIIDRGEVDQVNALLRTWTKNAQPLPDGLPADVRDFMESARQLPSWADAAKLEHTKDFYARRGTYFGALYGMGSGMMSTLIPHEARAVYYSNGGFDLKDRISKTAKLGYDIGSQNAFDDDGEMIVTSVKTRLIHAAVRHLLPKSAHWAAVADEDKPISQRDIMITWHSLASYSWKKMNEWKLKIPQADGDAYLHSWQVSAHLLGVLDEYIPATWSEASSQSTQLLDPLLAATPEGLNLADRLLHLASEYDGGASLSVPVLHDAVHARQRSRHVAQDSAPAGLGQHGGAELADVRRHEGGLAHARTPAQQGAVLGVRRVPAPGHPAVPVRGRDDQHRAAGGEQPEHS